ncbi:MAG: SDR family NAD(P)-dependent oxidoreductase, partial [Lentisphaeria bacterium]
MDSFLDVLITGGARGIGYGIVRALAQKNCNIGFCGRAPQEKIAPILTALRADFPNHFEYYSCDISNTDARRKLIQNFMTDFGCIDVLINNAGVAPENRADILDMTEESYHRLIKINAAGPFFLTQLAAKEIIANTNKKFHCIINISSVSASYASINRGEYCISKAAVSMATKLW